MDDELISKLDVFVTKIVKYINKPELVPEIQQEYDDIIEFLKKCTILANEEFEQFEKAINQYQEECQKKDNQIKNYEGQINSLNEEVKSLKEQLINNKNLQEQFKKLNEDYNNLKKIHIKIIPK